MALSGSPRALDQLLGVKPSFLDTIAGDSRENGFGNTHANTRVNASVEDDRDDEDSGLTFAVEADHEWNNRHAVLAELGRLSTNEEAAEELVPAAQVQELARPVVAQEVMVDERSVA